MYKATRPYGNKNRPLSQDDSGALNVNVNSDALNVNFDSPLRLSPPAVYPSPSLITPYESKLRGAPWEEACDFVHDEDVYLHVRHMRNYGDNVEIIASTLGSPSSKSGIYRSIDNGESWSRISLSSVVPSGYILSTGRSVINITEGSGGTRTDVWVKTDFDASPEEGWTKVIDAASGEFSPSYGKSIKGNVVILSVYGVKNASNPPRHIYVSQDFGETFSEIEVTPLAEIPHPETYHLHDVEYDTYADRIWLTNGDGTSSGMQYSDDFGETWVRVDWEGGMSTQATGILALADKVLFFTDDKPDGVKVYRRDPTNPKAPFDPNNFEQQYILPDLMATSGTRLASVAHSNRADPESQIDVYPYCLMTIMNTSESDGTGRLIASPDGEQWYQIHRLKQGTQFYSNVAGPVSNDPERRIFYSVYDRDLSQMFGYTAKFPKWVEMR